MNKISLTKRQKFKKNQIEILEWKNTMSEMKNAIESGHGKEPTASRTIWIRPKKSTRQKTRS